MDNSEWAPVSATYTKLNDPLKEGVTAVRLKVEKVDEGQLQLTSWTKPVFKKGVKYVIAGWIRSPENAGMKVGVRQPGEPREFYADQDLTAAGEWKPFTFASKPCDCCLLRRRRGSLAMFRHEGRHRSEFL